MLLPNSATLPINILSQSFNNTTNSYKFYWLWAILEHLQKDDRAQIALSDLALHMVSLVWYPLDFYKLSFGQQDSFKRVAQYLSSHLTIDNAPHAKPLIEQIYQKLQPADISNILKSNEIKIILKYVPYRFQSPFFVDELAGVSDASKNAKIVELANRQHKKVFYTYTDQYIVIDADWLGYWQEHQAILRNYIWWNLLQFVQKNNPNTIGLAQKLHKPQARDLNLAYKFWDCYFELAGGIRCVYSKQYLQTDSLSIDHFIPWSYVAHDQIWNLLPTTKSINSSKNNTLPNLDLYLLDFIELQYQAFHAIYNAHIQQKQKFLIDYTHLLGLPIGDIAQLAKPQFEERFKHIILQMHQTAVNMGFAGNWNITKAE